MSTAWRIAFAVILASEYLVFCYLDRVNVTLKYASEQLNMNALAHSQVLGVFAGFAATIVVIFLTREREEGSVSIVGRVCRRVAVGTFLCAVLHSILGSFLYASVAGTPNTYSAAGGPSQSNAQLADPVSTYLFSLCGIEYFLAVFLGFYGLALAVHYFISAKELPLLTCFMLCVVHLVGGAFLFADFSLTMLSLAPAFSFKKAGLFYVLPVVVGMLLPLRLRLVQDTSIPPVAYYALAFSLVCAGAIVLIHGGSPTAVDFAARLPEFVRYTLWVTSVALGMFFGILFFCLNRMLSEPAFDESQN